jgi:cysteinyl-tRNA synthetase
MTVRFFILQAHYRGTLDFSNEALQGAEKAYKRLMQAARDLYAMAGRKLPDIPYGELGDAVAPDACDASSEEVRKIFDGVYDALCDDLNTPIAISWIFEAVRLINSAKAGSFKPGKGDIETLVQIFDDIVFGVLGLRDEEAAGEAGGKVIDGLMQMVLEERAKAREAKDWAMSDHIRDSLKALGIVVKDTKDGAEWTLE